MREILFRGKRRDNGKWVEGNLEQIKYDEICYSFICHMPYDFNHPSGCCRGEIKCTGFGVDTETVGQFTGLNDNNGKKIFEGDIIRDLTTYIVHKNYFEMGFKGEENYEKYRTNAKTAVVEFDTENVGSCGCCFPTFVGVGFKAGDIDMTCCEVIGNIHDNLELLKGC